MEPHPYHRAEGPAILSDMPKKRSCACKSKRGLGATGETVKKIVRARDLDRRYLRSLSSTELRRHLCVNRQQFDQAPTPFGRRVASEVLHDYRDEAKRRGRGKNWIKLAEQCRAV